jgi:uncharacterized protein (TIGR03790 family)
MNEAVWRSACRVAWLLPAFSLFVSAPATAQSAENVAIVINAESAQSEQIAQHYIRSRGIPAANVIRIRTPLNDTIERDAYVVAIERPIAAALRRHSLQDRVLYIVLTKGVPLRIEGTAGADGTVSSVDSELTLLYRRMTGREAPVRGRVDNPYYLGSAPLGSAQAFTHRAHDIYLVTRLDGFTTDDVIALIDRAQNPSSDGRIILDQRGDPGNKPGGDSWLAEAHARLSAVGYGNRTVLRSTPSATPEDAVLGYFSWGSNDPKNRTRQSNMRFVPGAIVATFVSTDARTFQPPPSTWTPTNNWDDRSSWFAGSPQTLTGDFVSAGATGVAGQVAEPYLQSTVRPEILFPAYVSGFNVVESFYLAIPHLSWQTIVVGDPLSRPFQRAALTREQIEDEIDRDTELPGLFAARRQIVARAALKAAPAAALTLLLRAEARADRGDAAGTQAALEQATALDSSLSAAQFQLAVMVQRAGDFAAAASRYRHVLTVEPNHVIALNNLAEILAVHHKAYEEALPLARKAATLAPGTAAVLDTLAWIQHLRGDSEEGAKTFARALELPGLTAEIHLHAAIVFAATGAWSTADGHLQTALKLQPSLAEREDVVDLRRRLARQ